MTFTFREAKRENVPLLIGLAGGTGSGKTYSALRLATGLANGKKFTVIDTENGRASLYADDFTFDVADLTAPFRPDAYAEAIEAAAAAGYPVIVVDSMSHEWAGDGGLLDMQEEDFQARGGREAAKLSSWIKPKMAHKRLVTRLLQVNAHVILCFRAEQKIEMVKDSDGKWQIVPKKSLTGLDGWVPITEKSLPFELTASFLLTAEAPGYPKPIKLPEPFLGMFAADQPIAESAGKRLAEWAAGKTGPVQDPQDGQATNGNTAGTGGAGEWASEADVTEVLEIAASIDPDTHDKAVAGIARHRTSHDGKVDAKWLAKQSDALLKKASVNA